jgi:hypothetical protein
VFTARYELNLQNCVRSSVFTARYELNLQNCVRSSVFTARYELNIQNCVRSSVFTVRYDLNLQNCVRRIQFIISIAFPFVFRRVRKTARIGNDLRHVCHSVRMEQFGCPWTDFLET